MQLVIDLDFNTLMFLLLALVIWQYFNWRSVCGKPEVHVLPEGTAHKIIKMCPILNEVYVPTPYLTNTHLASIVGIFFRVAPPVKFESRILPASDGGEIFLEWASCVTHREPTNVIFVLVPGVSGSSRSFYVRHLAHQILQLGHRLVLINHRGRARKLLTPRAYSSAATEDLSIVMRTLSHECPADTVYFGMGISLGAMLMTKYMAETGDRCPFISACFYSNPWDLACVSEALGRFPNNLMYLPAVRRDCVNYFTRTHSHVFDSSDKIDKGKLLRSRSFEDLNQAVVVPMFGYKTVEEYYQDASAVINCSKIMRPVLYFQSYDDQMTVPEKIPFFKPYENENISIAITKTGAHGAWPTGWFPFHESYVDHVMVQWIQAALIQLVPTQGGSPAAK